MQENSVEVMGRNLFLLRVKHRLNQKEMALILGIGLLSLRKLEKGIIPPRLTVEMLYRIHDHFGITPSNLMDPGYFECK